MNMCNFAITVCKCFNCQALGGVDPSLNMVSSFDRGCLAALVNGHAFNISRALIAETLPEDWQNIANELKL